MWTQDLVEELLRTNAPAAKFEEVFNNQTALIFLIDTFIKNSSNSNYNTFFDLLLTLKAKNINFNQTIIIGPDNQISALTAASSHPPLIEHLQTIFEVKPSTHAYVHASRIGYHNSREVLFSSFDAEGKVRAQAELERVNSEEKLRNSTGNIGSPTSDRRNFRSLSKS